VAAFHAYAAIGHPTEGTILTVMREAGDRALASDSEGLAHLLASVCDAAYEAVRMTPTLLPTLRRAGLVDAGGYGLYIILEGMHLWAQGADPTTRRLSPPNPEGVPQATGEISEAFLDEIETEEYGSCTQFVVQSEGLDLDSIRERLLDMGQSSVVIGHSEVVRVHVHAADPGPILAYGESLGQLSQVNVQDMDEQRRQYSHQRREELGQRDARRLSVVAVAQGQGIEAVFKECGVSQILQGGDTMNPSVGQILSAVEDAPTNDVLFLPNNPNILSAANQAVPLTSKNLEVVPSLTIPQGIAAMLEFVSEGEPATIAAPMAERLAQVRTGEVCASVRTVRLDGVDVAEGQIIGLLDRVLVAAGDLPSTVLTEMLQRAVTDSTELVTLFWGQNVAEQEAVDLRDALADAFDGVEFELVQGGQPYYHYLVSIE
jgi:DAK2 domain fusion protein YloV